MFNIRIPATEPRIVIEFYNLASVSLQVDLTGSLVMPPI